MISHSQVQDQRGQWRGGIGFSRLPIGYFTLTLAGEITDVDWTPDPYDAELRGTVTTTRGSLTFSALVQNDTGALPISTRPTPGEESAAWSFQWLRAATTRSSGKPADYTPNPDPRVGDGFVEQPLLAGGGWSIAWRERSEGTGRLLAAHLVYRFPGQVTEATDEALRAVDRTLTVGPEKLVDRHRRWWHAYYRRSFLSVPDKRLQSFYLIQLYKLAASTRAEGPMISEWGPWFPEIGNNWTAVWWNLNVQIGMAPIHGSNHPELDSVTNAFRHFEHILPASVPAEYRDGESYALGHPPTGSCAPATPTTWARPARTTSPTTSATSPGPCTTSGSPTGTRWTSESCATWCTRSSPGPSTSMRTSCTRARTGEHSVTGRIDVRDGHGRPLHWRDSGPGRITVTLPRGGTAVITPHGARRPEPGPRDVPSNGTWTRWGLPG
ncbi:hypothetical protein [Streptomyces sp. NPDC057582]|uniref:hypothetical protein n=1 Tax=Streptomyces sp. NPDC057582 TaxID=3346174 RepID=UPI0036BBE2F5